MFNDLTGRHHTLVLLYFFISAVIYECLETILSIWPQPAMVEHAANCVAKFLSSKNINLRYLGKSSNKICESISQLVTNDYL